MSSPRPIPVIRGTQVGLKRPEQVDDIKQAMIAGAFPYQEERIGGVRSGQGVYYVVEGHHRMVAALEILAESGELQPLFQLLHWGKFDLVDKPPIDSRPMPSRDWWGRLRNWIGF